MDNELEFEIDAETDEQAVEIATAILGTLYDAVWETEEND